MTAQRNQIQFRQLETPQICDICQRKRSIGNHQKCSRKRQQMNAHKWGGK